MKKLKKLFQCNYVPLVSDFPAFDAVSKSGGDFASVINSLITTVIGLAGVLAVLMIVIGGIQYVSTDAWQGKSDGKKRIQAALGGLLLALSSYLILNTIDPSLTRLNFADNLQVVSVPVASSTGIVVVPGTAGGTSTSTNPNTPSEQPPQTGGGTVNGIPYGGAFNKTLQNWQRSNGLNADGIENLNTLKTVNGVQYVWGKGSTFGGPNDTGVTATETGAVSGEVLRSLDPGTYYIAGRWDYSAMKVSAARFEVMNPRTGVKVVGVRPVDWGPHPRTGRVWDVSPGVMSALGASTDQELCVRVN